MSTSSTLLDHPIVSSRYFFPRKAPFPDPYWVTAADGSRLACYHYIADPEAKTVVYFHGNGEVVADYLPAFASWITGAGYNLLLAEYRGYGMSDGQPALAGMLEDAVACIESLQVPDEKVVLFGRSIGSLYALHGIYRHPQIGGLIIESGVSDLSERFFERVSAEELGTSRSEVVAELQEYFDFVHKLGGFQGKTLILHARFDELLSADHAERLYSAAREPKQLHIFDQGGHNDIFFRNRTAYMQLVESFLAAV